MYLTDIIRCKYYITVIQPLVKISNKNKNKNIYNHLQIQFFFKLNLGCTLKLGILIALLSIKMKNKTLINYLFNCIIIHHLHQIIHNNNAEIISNIRPLLIIKHHKQDSRHVWPHSKIVLIRVFYQIIKTTIKGW